MTSGMARRVRFTALSFAIPLLGCSCWGCAGEAEGGSDPGDLQVRRGSVAPTLLLTGELTAEDAMIMVAPSVGIFPLTLRWIADEGQAVSAGDTLAEFDNTQLAGNIEALRSEVTTAGNELQRAEAQSGSDRVQKYFELEEAKAAWEKARLAAELPREMTSEQEWAKLQLELEKAERNLHKAEKALAAAEESAEATIGIQRLALEKAETALGRAESGIDELRLEASRDGIVVVHENFQEDRPFRAGDTTWVGMPIVSLPDLDTLYVRATLFDVDDGQIAEGASVVASLDAFPDEILHGTVRSVAGFAEQQGRRSSRRSFEVAIDLEGLDTERMRPGMSVKIEVERPAEEGLVVPRGTLAFGGKFADLRLADGSWRSVEVAACDVAHCLVTGIEEGRRLALANGAAPPVEADASAAESAP